MYLRKRIYSINNKNKKNDGKKKKVNYVLLSIAKAPLYHIDTIIHLLLEEKKKKKKKEKDACSH
jgi:hypothetical protein